MTTASKEMPNPFDDGAVQHMVWTMIGPPLGMFLATAVGLLATYLTVRLATIIALREHSRGSLPRHQMPVVALLFGASLVAMGLSGVVVPVLWDRYLDGAQLAELARAVAVLAVLAGVVVGASLSVSHAVRAPLP